MVSVPVASAPAVVVKLAVPVAFTNAPVMGFPEPAVPVTGALPSEVPFEKKVTVAPGGLPKLGSVAVPSVRVAVSVEVPPAAIVDGFAETEADVRAFVIVKLSAAEVLALKLASW